MKPSLMLVVTLAVLSMASGTGLLAQDKPATAANLANWGTPVNPDGDCKILTSEDTLMISVPGGRPHDLAAELGVTNAPRVVQAVNGDFTLQVQVDGRYAPGDASTLSGRTGYNGAALIAMVDAKNVVTLARAVLQRSGEAPVPYLNFELRVNGQLKRLGLTNDRPLPLTGPLFLRLERRGKKLLGAVSTDGAKWDVLPAKDYPATWPSNLQVGVAAISTSKEEFNPRFSLLQLLK